MLTAVLSLTGAFVFGAADFLGGLAAKRIGAVLATAVASVAGFIGLAVATPLSGGAWTAADLWWGAAAGVAGAVAIGLLYACLAIGPMSILSPLTAVVSAIVPMLWGLATGARLGPLAPWALGLALVAVVLVGFVPERGAVRPSLTGIAMGIGSGTAIGAFFILIDRTSDESGLAPLAVNSAVTAVVIEGHRKTVQPLQGCHQGSALRLARCFGVATVIVAGQRAFSADGHTTSPSPHGGSRLSGCSVRRTSLRYPCRSPTMWWSSAAAAMSACPWRSPSPTAGCRSCPTTSTSGPSTP